MELARLSRWDALPVDNMRSKRSKRFMVALVGLFAITTGSSWVALGYWGFHNESNSLSSDLAEELRDAVTNVDTPDALGLSAAMARLFARVEALEAEHRQLTSDMNGVIGQDGAIDRLVTHVRALHAENEATRRDVVGALMAPLAEINPASGADETATSMPMPMEGEPSPLLSKAKHTIVTPVAAAPEATPAAPELKPTKVRAKDTQADEGETN